MPLQWSEVKDGLQIMDFTIANAPERIAQMNDDPMLPVLTTRPDFGEVFGRLGEVVGGEL